MDSDKIVGHRVVSEIWAVKGQDGQWRVDHRVVASRTEDFDTWETKDLEASGISKNLDTAISSAAFTIAEYLESVGGDIFSIESYKEEKESLM